MTSSIGFPDLFSLLHVAPSGGNASTTASNGVADGTGSAEMLRAIGEAVPRAEFDLRAAD